MSLAFHEMDLNMIINVTTGSVPPPLFEDIRSLENVDRTGGYIPVILRLAIVPVLLLFTANTLWRLYNESLADPNCKLPLPPGDFGIPVLGESLHFIANIAKFFRTRRLMHGNVFKTHILGRPTIRVIGAQNIKQVLLRNTDTVESHTAKSLQLLLGSNSLSSVRGDVHKYQRRLMMKALNRPALQGYTPTICSILQKNMARWSEKDTVLGHPEAKCLNFEIGARVMMGLQLTREETFEAMKEYEGFSECFFSMPFNLPGSGLRRGLFYREKMLERIDNEMKRREAGEQNDNHDDILSYLLDQNSSEDPEEKMSAETIRDILMESLFASHAPISSAMVSCILQLSRHPDVVRRLSVELARVGLDEPNGEAPGYGEISQLPYLNNVLKEVLRVTPPVGGGFRKAVRTFEIDGHQIPAGWTVMYSIRDTHEASDYFVNKESFDPERWNDVGKDSRFHFLPFGLGRRACIGKDLATLIMKMFIVELVRSYSWTLVNPNPTFNFTPVPYPSDGLPIRVRQLEESRHRAFTF